MHRFACLTRSAAACATLALVVSLAFASTAGATVFSFTSKINDAANLKQPQFLEVDRSGGRDFLYVTDFDPAGNTVSNVHRYHVDGTPANFTAGPAAGTNVLGPNFTPTVTDCSNPGANGATIANCFNQIQGVAVDPASGHFFVSEYQNSRVDEFDSAGTLIRTFGASFDSGGGAGTDTLFHPEGVAVDSTGKVFVADPVLNNRVIEFDPTQAGNAAGGFVRLFGSTGSGASQLSGPEGVAVDNADHLYIADRNNERISVWTVSTGTNLSTFPQGTPPGGGDQLGQFNDPQDIEYSPGDGNLTPPSLFVLDQNNHRVQQFNPNGTPIASFGSAGAGDGEFLTPAALGVFNDPTRGTTVLVADRDSKLIQRFDPVPKPTNVTVPVVSGNPVRDQTLATTNGTWTNSPTSFTYQWQRCDGNGNNCVSIAGANGTNYIVTGDDVGAFLRSCVVAINGNGPSGAACSAITAQVTAPAPPVNKPPVVTPKPGPIQKGPTVAKKSATTKVNGIVGQGVISVPKSCVKQPNRFTASARFLTIRTLRHKTLPNRGEWRAVKVDFTLDGKTKITDQTGSSFSAVFNTLSLKKGKHAVKANVFLKQRRYVKNKAGKKPRFILKTFAKLYQRSVSTSVTVC